MGYLLSIWICESMPSQDILWCVCFEKVTCNEEISCFLIGAVCRWCLLSHYRYMLARPGKTEAQFRRQQTSQVLRRVCVRVNMQYQPFHVPLSIENYLMCGKRVMVAADLLLVYVHEQRLAYKSRESTPCMCNIYLQVLCMFWSRRIPWTKSNVQFACHFTLILGSLGLGCVGKFDLSRLFLVLTMILHCTNYSSSKLSSLKPWWLSSTNYYYTI